MSRSFYPGRVDLQVRDERVPNVRPEGGQDRRTGAEYLAALERETEVSLRRSASWRDGQPLADHREQCDCERTLAGCVERRLSLRSGDLGSRAGIPQASRRSYGAERERYRRYRERQRNGGE